MWPVGHQDSPCSFRSSARRCGDAALACRWAHDWAKRRSLGQGGDGRVEQQLRHVGRQYVGCEPRWSYGMAQLPPVNTCRACRPSRASLPGQNQNRGTTHPVVLRAAGDGQNPPYIRPRCRPDAASTTHLVSEPDAIQQQNDDKELDQVFAAPKKSLAPRLLLRLGPAQHLGQAADAWVVGRPVHGRGQLREGSCPPCGRRRISSSWQRVPPTPPALQRRGSPSGLPASGHRAPQSLQPNLQLKECRGWPTITCQADVLSTLGREVSLLRSVQAPIDPGQGGVPSTAAHLTSRRGGCVLTSQ